MIRSSPHLLAGTVALIVTTLSIPGPATAADLDLLVAGFRSHAVLRFDGNNGHFVEVFANGHGLSQPTDLELDSIGRLYVSSTGNNAVLRFDGRTGAFIDSFVRPGAGGLQIPQGIAIGPDDHLYVAGYVNGSILRFNGLTGAFMGVFASDKRLEIPLDVAFFGGDMFVTNQGLHRILRFDGETGELIRVFAEGAPLAGPAGMRLGPRGDVLIANRAGHAVLRYQLATGAYLKEFAVEGLYVPFDLIYGPDDNLYVTSVLNDSVFRYDGATGKPIDVFASGHGLVQPTGVVFQQRWCPEDVNNGGTVDVEDVLSILGAWGSYGPCPPFRRDADVNRDCEVDVDDLLAVLSKFSNGCR